MDGLYELFLVKDPKLDLYQGIFSTFPDLQEYSMNDLYTKHPDPAKGFLYKWTGRADDVIVLSNGEKLAPALMEASLMSAEAVKGAMVVGRGKFQPAALLDLGEAPPDTPSGRRAMLKEILPAIQEANKHAPAHGQLDQYHILFVDQNRPIYYLGQGKIQRRQTYSRYEQDFEDLYTAAENFDEQLGTALEGDISELSKVDFGDQSSIVKWLQELIAETAEINNLDEEDAFFEFGMDSLHVIRLVRELKFQAKLSKSETLTPELLSPGVVYAHPSLHDLSSFLFKHARLANPDIDSAYQSADESEGDPKLSYMESQMDKYTKSLPAVTIPRPTPVTEATTVLLTGSTGSLGSYLLNELNNDPNVAHIICVDRTSSAAEKHKKDGPKRGLTPLDPRRVEFLKGDLADPHLGFGEETYERLLSSVSHIIRKSSSPPINENKQY